MTLMEEAESLILHQFAKSPKLNGLIRSLVKPFQEVLDQIEAMHHGRYIDTAHGQSLDVLGDIVGQSRQYMADGDYRPWIDVGIKLNSCTGTPEDVSGILRILYGHKPQVFMHEYHPHHVVFIFFALPKISSKALLGILRSAAPVTTVCHFIRADMGSTFRFDDSPLIEPHFADFFTENIL
jgi:hypothetical protein